MQKPIWATTSFPASCQKTGSRLRAFYWADKTARHHLTEHNEIATQLGHQVRRKQV